MGVREVEAESSTVSPDRRPRQTGRISSAPGRRETRDASRESVGAGAYRLPSIALVTHVYARNVFTSSYPADIASAVHGGSYPRRGRVCAPVPVGAVACRRPGRLRDGSDSEPKNLPPRPPPSPSRATPECRRIPACVFGDGEVCDSGEGADTRRARAVRPAAAGAHTARTCPPCRFSAPPGQFPRVSGHLGTAHTATELAHSGCPVPRRRTRRRRRCGPRPRCASWSPRRSARSCRRPNVATSASARATRAFGLAQRPGRRFGAPNRVLTPVVAAPLRPGCR